MPNSHSAEHDHIELTRAEAEVLHALAAENMTNAGLAEHFGVSEAAINSRLHRLYERTELHGRTAAVVFAVQHMECCVARAIS